MPTLQRRRPWGLCRSDTVWRVAASCTAWLQGGTKRGRDSGAAAYVPPSPVLRRNPLAVIIPTTELPTVSIGGTMCRLGAGDGTSEDSDSDSDQSEASCDSHCDSDGGCDAGHTYASPRDVARLPGAACYVVNVTFGNEEAESLHRAVISVPLAAVGVVEAVAAGAVGTVPPPIAFKDIVAAAPDASTALVVQVVDALVEHGALSWA